MRSPYDLTPAILRLIVSISQKVGEVNAGNLVRQSPALRKQNRIKTIYSSLIIEGNTLSVDQMTAIIDHQRVLGPEKDIREVLNAIGVYSELRRYRLDSEKDFLKAHSRLMKGLVALPGQYRTKAVGILKGSSIRHVAPPASNVGHLMLDLFRYIGSDPELYLIKACVFHYELEFIHPFMDGNGRMGRLWQTVILMRVHLLFEYLPVESLIADNQKEYYQVLTRSDKEGKSTRFIEFMLTLIDRALTLLLANRTHRLAGRDRLELFLEEVSGDFTRKDYMARFRDMSSATASRDLKMAVEARIIIKRGDKKTTVYRKIRQRK